jgi:hypothetical protein
MKFKGTIEFTYEVPEPLEDYYGTSSIEKCTEIDKNNLNNDFSALFDIMASCDDAKVTKIEPLKQRG